MNSTVKTVLFWLLIGVSALLLWEVVKSARDGQKDKEVNVTQFMSDVDQNNVREITVNGMEVRGKFRDGSAFHTNAPTNYFTPEMLKNLQGKGVNIVFRDINSGSLPLQLLVTKDPTGKTLRDVDWLVRSYAVTILPSVMSLHLSC